MKLKENGYQNFLVLDFEFTVNNQRVGRPRFFFQEIIEVGAVWLCAPNYEIELDYQAFVKPRFYSRLTDECKNITLIKQEDIDNGLPLEEMLSLLNTLYEPGKTLIVAWGNADREVLKLVCQRYGISYPYVWEDYVDLAAEYKSFYNRPRNIGLKKALEERGLKPIGIPHSALDDTYNTAQILVSMLRQGWTPQSNSLPLVQEM